MLVNEVMTKQFPICQENDSIQTALKQFSTVKLHIIPVVNKRGQLSGILTKNKLIQALANDTSMQHSIESFINRKPIFLTPDLSIAETRTKLLENRLGHAPVINEQREPIGIMSTSQILYAYDKVFDRLESELQLIFNHLDFGLFSVDVHYRMLSMNSVAQQFLQYPSMEKASIENNELPESLLHLLHEVLFERKAEAKAKIQLNENSLFVKCYPLKEKNKLIGSMVLMEDMTVLEETAKELQFSKDWEEKLRTVVELAYDGIVLVDENAIITMANQGFCELYSIHEKDLLGMSISTILPELGLEEVMRTGVKLTNVPKMIKNTQSLITVLPIKDDEAIVGAICKITYQGLTQLQTALQKVNTLEKQITIYQKEINELKGTKYSFADIAGESSAIQKAKKEALAASRTRSTVLLLGESGTGKELFAHGIHAASQQTGLFVQVNCAAIPHELLESEFFGYAEGAFTGAKKGGKKGKFELAQNGTLFLDEIGDMPLPLQTKLLRVLQEKEFEPIGSNRTIQLDTKIIAATNQNLEQLIADGKFREDLYYRLNIMRIEIPPLRERIEDIPDIVNQMIAKLNESGFQIGGITHAALTRLLNYEWPGNIRELQNWLERAANLTTDAYLDEMHLPTASNNATPPQWQLQNISQAKTITKAMYNETLLQTEKELIQKALQDANGNKAQASRLLGISRTWLYAKMKKYGIES